MSKSSMTFIVETTNHSDVTGLVAEISQLLSGKGFSEGLSFRSDDGKSGSIIFVGAPEVETPASIEPNPESEVTVAPTVLPANPGEMEITLGSAIPAPDNVPDTAAIPGNLELTIPSVTTDPQIAVPDNMSNLPTKSGIVFIKSLLPSEPVPYKCNMENDLSELHVGQVSYQNDLITFTYRNTVFKFPIEADKSSNDFVVIRTVLSVDNSENVNTVYLKVVDDRDDNHVVFGNQDTEQLGLIEQLSAQS